MARTDQRALPIPLMVLAAVLLIARFAWVASPKHSLVKWVTPGEGIALARATGKPILYDFTAEWCQPCHRLEEAVFDDPELAARINETFVPVRVTDRQREEGKNPPDVAELQKRYGVSAFPTVVFADAGGSEQARIAGFRGRGQFELVMARVR